MRFRCLTAGIVLVFVVGFSLIQGTQGESDFLKEAVEFYKARRYEACVEACNRIIDANDRFAEAFRRRGLAYWRLRKYDRALNDFSRTLALEPNNNKAYNDRANVYYNLKRYQDGVHDTDAALRIDPNHVAAYITRALCRRELKDAIGARADLDRAVQLDPRNSTALVNRGLLKFEAGDPKGAIADYDLALSIAPNNTTALPNRSTVRRTMGDLDGAIEDVSRIIKQDPGDADAYANRGLYRMLKGDLAAARSDLNEALRLNPQQTQAARNLQKLGERAQREQTAAIVSTTAQTERTSGTVVDGTAAGKPATPKDTPTRMADTSMPSLPNVIREEDTHHLALGSISCWTANYCTPTLASTVSAGEIECSCLHENTFRLTIMNILDNIRSIAILFTHLPARKVPVPVGCSVRPEPGAGATALRRHR
jgi:tetratricopeptide (TPR) repeat protein